MTKEDLDKLRQRENLNINLGTNNYFPGAPLVNEEMTISDFYKLCKNNSIFVKSMNKKDFNYFNNEKVDRYLRKFDKTSIKDYEKSIEKYNFWHIFDEN